MQTEDIYTLHYKRLYKSFNYLIKKEAENSEGISETDRASIIAILRRLNVYIDGEKVLNLMGIKKTKNYVIIYWCIKDLYFSSFKPYLNNIDMNFLNNRYLKTLENLKIKEVDTESDDCERIVKYFIKTLKREYEVKEQ